MASAYRRGMTLQQIGDIEGVSRERVRQILKAAGCAREERGSAMGMSMVEYEALAHRRAIAVADGDRNGLGTRLAAAAEVLAKIAGTDDGLLWAAWDCAARELEEAVATCLGHIPGLSPRGEMDVILETVRAAGERHGLA